MISYRDKGGTPPPLLQQRRSIMALIDMCNQKINRWTVLRFDRYDNRGEAYWLCRCDCGEVKSIAGYTLRKGTSKGCRLCREPRRLGSKFNIIDDVAYFTTSNGEPFTVSYADAESVSKHSWCLRQRDGYPVASINNSAVCLHTFLLGRRNGMYVDHINGDKSDNRRANLRWASPTESAWNLGISSRNTSGFKGVHWNVRNQQWQANIRAHNRQFFLGWFSNREEAALAYNEAAKELHGKYACINPIGDTEGYRVTEAQYVN
jgi:hypothetical protein